MAATMPAWRARNQTAAERCAQAGGASLERTSAGSHVIWSHITLGGTSTRNCTSSWDRTACISRRRIGGTTDVDRRTEKPSAAWSETFAMSADRRTQGCGPCGEISRHMAAVPMLQQAG